MYNLTSEEGPGGHRAREEEELGLRPGREIGLGGMPGRGTDVYPKASKGCLAGPGGRTCNS